jgi:hypothetical protein
MMAAVLEVAGMAVAPIMEAKQYQHQIIMQIIMQVPVVPVTFTHHLLQVIIPADAC